MNKFLAVALLLLSPLLFSQAARVDVPIQTSGPNVPASGGPLPQALWLSNAKVSVCQHPAPTIAQCTPAVTYTDSTMATPCPSTAPLVQLPGSACTATAGSRANVGFWYGGGTVDYFVSGSYGLFGPYSAVQNATLQPGGPAFTAQFANPGVNGFLGDATITINPTTHTFTAPNFVLSGLTPGVLPICPNGSGGALTTSGCSSGAAGNPGGSNTQLQFNNSSVFGGASATWDGSYINTPNDLPTGHQLASANASVVVNSVLAYGAKADRLSGFAISMSVGNPSMTCASCTFTAADVGKYVMFIGWTAQPFAAVTFTPMSNWTPINAAKINTVTDATHVVLSKSALNTFTSPGMAYGTENGPAFNACTLDLANNSVAGGTCKVPAGNYLFATANYYSRINDEDDGTYGTTVGGSGAVITATLGSGATAGQIVSYTVVSGGSGYTPNSSLAIVASGLTACVDGGVDIGPCGGVFAYATTNSSGVVNGVTPLFNGFGFITAPTLTVSPMAGDGAAATVTVSGGAINSSTVTAPGAGYGGNFDVFGVGGTGCAAIAGLQNVAGVTITARGTAVTTAGGVTSLTWSNAGSGCSAPPTVLFGDYTCGNPLTSQCTNITPLAPFIIPVQVLLVQGVSFEGPATQLGNFGQTAILNGVWDGKTADSNQPALFGSNLYLKNQSINNIAFGQTYLGLLVPFSAATSKVSNNSFSGAIGWYYGATDLGLISEDNTYYGYAAAVGGGQWNTRRDETNIVGGFFNSQAIVNPWSFSLPYNATAIAIDNWFAANFWHPEFSALNTDFLEPCSFPQSPNQRQTSNTIKFPPGVVGNNMCYPGITGSSMTELTRNGGGSNAHNITNMGAKYCYRYVYYGNYAGGVLDGAGGCEQGTSLVSDPYRTSVQQHAPIVFPGGAASSPNTITRNTNWQESGTVTQPVWSLGSANGIPASRWSNLSCASCSATPAALLGDSIQANQNINGTSTAVSFISPNTNPLIMAGTSGPVTARGPMVLLCPSNTTQPTWNTNGVFYGGCNSSASGTTADIFQWFNTGASEIISIASDGGITNTGANAFNGTTSFNGVAFKQVADVSISIASFAIPANTCYGSTGSTTPATASMTGLTTAMLVTPGFTGNASAITGWGTAGGLSLMAWPSASNTASYLVCNATSGSITGGAITLVLGAK